MDDVRIVRECLYDVDAIYLETDNLTDEMKKRGYFAAETVPNFSMRSGNLKSWQYSNDSIMCRCFTFSRVTKTKGIGEAIDAIRILNGEKSGKRYTLDIYGPLDENYKEKFYQKISECGEDIRYCGVLNGNDILPTLSDHDLMLFPTYYDGEGMPGAVIESFMAGVPVIASDWHNNAEVVKNAYTGIVYPLGDINNLIAAIRLVTERNGELDRMHDNCMEERKKYQPETIMQTVFNDIDGGEAK